MEQTLANWDSAYPELSTASLLQNPQPGDNKHQGRKRIFATGHIQESDLYDDDIKETSLSA